MSSRHFERDPQELLKKTRLIHFPDDSVLDVTMIAACLHKSIRTVYRLFENGELPLAHSPKMGAYGRDVKALVLRKCSRFNHSEKEIMTAASSSSRRFKGDFLYLRGDSLTSGAVERTLKKASKKFCTMN